MSRSDDRLRQPNLVPPKTRRRACPPPLQAPFDPTEVRAFHRWNPRRHLPPWSRSRSGRANGSGGRLKLSRLSHSRSIGLLKWKSSPSTASIAARSLATYASKHVRATTNALLPHGAISWNGFRSGGTSGNTGAAHRRIAREVRAARSGRLGRVRASRTASDTRLAPSCARAADRAGTR